jgi:hypothetical protein
MTTDEIKTLAKKKKQEGEIDEALNLYKQLWEIDKNEWNGYFLALCLRKSGNYSEARELHKELEKSYPNFKPLQNDKLWLDYSEKIKDWQNPDLVKDAETLLSRADKYDENTSSIYTKTVLNVVKHLCFENNFKEAYIWLLKLDQSIISSSVYNYQGQTFPADRKVYFIRYADVLIQLNKHSEYIFDCLKSLNFKQSKISEFKKHILEDITFNDYVSRVKLARHIKNFQEEFHLRIKKTPSKIYKKDKTTLVSDLSHFLFCPVSFAINETFQIEANSTWEKDEWLGEKKLFIDRYNTLKRTKSYEETFSDSEISVNSDLKTNFDYLFSSLIRVNNATNQRPTVYSNITKDLIGAPDYILEDGSGNKFAITEKFSSIYSADSQTPFESDLVKHYAFIHELKNANIKFGYLITWYWQLKDIQTDDGSIKKKIIINSYRLTKIESSQINSNKLSRAISQVNNFKKTNEIKIDGESISFPNKCLSCSVISYCNHKTGNLNNVILPYELSLNKVQSEPRLGFSKESDTKTINNDEDDLPF